MANTTATLLRKTRASWANAMPKRPSRRPGVAQALSRLSSLLTLAALAACGGGGGEPVGDDAVTSGVDSGNPATGAVDPGDPATAAAYQYCTRVPPYPRAANVRQVRDFGAIPDDDRDDTDAIQRALDALQSGDTLAFAPGRYLMSKRLHVRREGVTVLGPNAVLHATNPDDQVLLIEADNITVASLTFTAVTAGRRTDARHARIAVYAEDGPGKYRPVYNTVLRDNKIINAGGPGTATANSSSAGGILMVRANGFLISGNTIVRTLADGIHITAGSKNGRVLNNVVRETGDDMIAMVSYADSGTPAGNKAQPLLQQWNARVETSLVRNVLVAGNLVSGQYWGRGISVVGGQSITITRNSIDNVPLAAGVLIAREAGYQTFGVENVLVETNYIRDVQTLRPGYDFQNTFAKAPRTGQGAVEIHSALFDDEAAEPTLRESLAVRNVIVRDNTIERSAVPGVRAGVTMTQTITGTNAAGQAVARRAVTGLIRNVGVENNRFNQVNSEPMRVLSQDLLSQGLHCSANARDGKGYESSACRPAASEPKVRGAPLSCSPDGHLL